MCTALSSNSNTGKINKKGKTLPMSMCQLYLIYVYHPETVLLISTISFVFTDFTKVIKYYVKQSKE
jgi:hypothetical protein